MGRCPPFYFSSRFLEVGLFSSYNRKKELPIGGKRKKGRMRMGLLTDLKQNLKKGIESTSQRSKKLVDISRLNIAIKGKREEEERLYRQLGKESYQLWEKKEKWEVTDSLRATLEQIQSIRNTIKQWEQQVEELKKQEEKERIQEEKSEQQMRQAAELTDAEPARSAEGKEPLQKSAPQPQSNAVEPKRELLHEQPQQAETFPSDLLAQLEGQALFICSHCGEQVKEDAVVCPHCRKHMYYD